MPHLAQILVPHPSIDSIQRSANGGSPAGTVAWRTGPTSQAHARVNSAVRLPGHIHLLGVIAVIGIEPLRKLLEAAMLAFFLRSGSPVRGSTTKSIPAVGSLVRTIMVSTTVINKGSHSMVLLT